LFIITEQAKWPIHVPQCGGRLQSPINILSQLVAHRNDLRIGIKNYNNPKYKFVAINNINYVSFSIDEQFDNNEEMPLLTGSAVYGEKYRFVEFYSQWSDNRFEGSGHMIDGKQFPFVVSDIILFAYALTNRFISSSQQTHFVHYNTKYDDYDSALGQPDGIVIIAVLHKLATPNANLRDISWLAKQTVNAKQTPVPARFGLRLRDLLPKRLNRFYRYTGSLPMPPCTEGVLWLVMKPPSQIGFEQLAGYRTVIRSNYRIPQVRGNRTVESSFNTRASDYDEFSDGKPDF